jgi:hypothetical protein
MISIIGIGYLTKCRRCPGEYSSSSKELNSRSKVGKKTQNLDFVNTNFGK